MKKQLPLTLVAILAAQAWNASLGLASIVFDNGNHVTDGRGSNVGSSRSADDFLIAGGATITDVHWKGLYGLSLPSPLPTDNFSISIYADNGSGFPTPPGSAIYTAAAGSLTRSPSGEMLLGNTIFEYSAVIPDFVAAPATTYWLEIINSTTTPWGWSMDAGAGNGVFTGSSSNWIRINDAYTFQLTNDFAVSGGVPEASTLAVWSILSGMGLFVGKRKLIV